MEGFWGYWSSEEGPGGSANDCDHSVKLPYLLSRGSPLEGIERILARRSQGDSKDQLEEGKINLGRGSFGKVLGLLESWGRAGGFSER